MTVLMEEPVEVSLRFLVEITVNFLGKEIHLFSHLHLLSDLNL
jgi:hypothetical protein